MRRPIRTRRLSIAAMASLLLFVAAASAGVRSFWRWDNFGAAKYGRVIHIEGGCVEYVHISPPPASGVRRHISGKSAASNVSIRRVIWGFSVRKGIYSTRPVKATALLITIPLWPFVLPLLIAPICWLSARPANVPAFPVVADAKHAQ